MKKLTISFLLFSYILNAQIEQHKTDQKYLEDQFYISAVYQKLLNLPDEVSPTGFSYGIGLGFIKDLPLNKGRNIGLGLGLGYSYNVHYFNVREFDLPIDNYTTNITKSNKIGLHMIDLPFELRFRTSTPEKYNFWRFYPGFKFSYAFAQNNNLKQRENFEVSKVLTINKFQYGLSLSVGYNKWNLHVYYGLTELFNETKGNNFHLAPHELKIGLIFYIL